MSTYKRCDCGGADRCFRCAIDFVIDRFGGNPNCECRKFVGAFCLSCSCRGDRDEDDENPLPAFEAATPPYRELAGLYARCAAMTVAAEEGGVLNIGLDREGGALRLLAAARSDPLAFDAALYMVAESVRFGSDIPKPLREWAFNAMTGRIVRPKMQGKYPLALNWRNSAIIGLIRDVRRFFHLHPTSADEEGGESACKAVAEGLRLLRLQPDS